MAQIVYNPYEDRGLGGYYPPPSPPSTSGGLTDDQIKAQYPWVPWGSLSGGGTAVTTAIRNAIAAGADVNQAAWAAIRSDPGFDTILPGFNQWASATGANAGSWTSLAQFNSDKANSAYDVDSMPPALQAIYSPDQLAILRSGNRWANPSLFGFTAWAIRNFHYYTDPQFTAYHGPPTYTMLYSAFSQGIEGSDLQYGWSVQAGEARDATRSSIAASSGAADQAAAEARADARQAAADAKQEADRIQRITTAGARIQAGYDPSIAALFTADELKNAAIWDAGGEWGDAKASREIALAGPVNQYFMHFYGRAVTRGEIDQYYASGATPEYVNQTLDSLGIQRAFPTALRGMFSNEEIKAYSDELAGIHTPTGRWLASVVSLAQDLNPVYAQYMGRAATRQEIEAHLAAGDTTQLVAGRFGGKAWEEANNPDVQYYGGAFGEGQLTPEQLTQLGQQEAGLGTPHGLLLQNKFEQAVARARVAFQGTLAHMATTNRFGATSSPEGRPDLAA